MGRGWHGESDGERYGWTWVPVDPRRPEPPTPLAVRTCRGPVFDRDGTLWWSTANGLRRIAHPEQSTMGAALRTEDIADAYSDTDGLTSRQRNALLPIGKPMSGSERVTGLIVFPNRVWTPRYSQQRSARFSATSRLREWSADDTGGLWSPMASMRLARYQGGRMKLPSCGNGREPGACRWHGMVRGPQCFVRERKGQLEPVKAPGADRPIQALAIDKTGGLGLGPEFRSLSAEGWVWTPNAVSPHCRRSPRSPSRATARSPMFSYNGGSAAVLDGDRVHTYGVTDGLQIGNVMDTYWGRIRQWFGERFGWRASTESAFAASGRRQADLEASPDHRNG